MKKQKLFAVLLGGKHEDAILELHDIRFTFAETRDLAFKNLAKAWFGSESTAHVDAWMDITRVDGHELCPEAQSDPNKKLFFVNLGSYVKGDFNENHQYLFLIGSTENEIKSRVKKKISIRQLKPHFDNVEEIDLILQITEVNAEKLSWKVAKTPLILKMDNGYWPLKKFI